jgi:acyl carrier protein
MCLKLGRDELDTVRNLMAMSLKAVVAEALGADLEDVKEEARLVEDLHRDATGAKALHELIADIFDDADIAPARLSTVADLLDKVVHSEFINLPGTGDDNITTGR